MANLRALLDEVKGSQEQMQIISTEMIVEAHTKLLGEVRQMNEELAKNQLRFAVSNVVTRAKKRDLEVAAQERVDHEKKVKVGAARAAKRAVTGSPQPPRKFTRDNFGRAHVS